MKDWGKNPKTSVDSFSIRRKKSFLQSLLQLWQLPTVTIKSEYGTESTSVKLSDDIYRCVEMLVVPATENNT